MIRTLHLKFLLVAAAALSSTAMPAAADPATDPTGETLTAQEREALAAAEQLAQEAAQVLEQWITTQAISEDRLFSRLYFPIEKTDPQKFTTVYDQLADRDLVSHEDKALARSATFQYAIVTDINGYVPAHNSRFAQALTGIPEKDYVNNRTKRILPDIASVNAARSKARYLVQRTKLDNGDVIYDISTPIVIRGKQWGCARVGYRRTE